MFSSRFDDVVYPAGVVVTPGGSGADPTVLWAAYLGQGTSKTLHGRLGLAWAGQKSIYSYSQL